MFCKLHVVFIAAARRPVHAGGAFIPIPWQASDGFDLSKLHWRMRSHQRGILLISGAGHSKREIDDASGGSLGQLNVEIEDAYIADRTSSVARLDKHSMKILNISAGDGVILFAGERPVIAKAFPLYPSDNRTGIIRISQAVRIQLNREVGEEVAVRGIGNTKIDKVVNYLLLDRLSRQDP